MPSFDVVSIVNMQEVKNAVDQVNREITTRYDFKGSKSSIELKEEEKQIIIVADDKMKLGAVQELLRLKLSKRGVSLKSTEWKDALAAGGDTIRQEVHVKQGLSSDELKKVNKAIKESKEKVTSQIQGDQIRVSGKKRDDLQSMIAFLRTNMKDLDLQFINFRE